ncbi:effector-associated domain EAD1-containing protein [Actinoplanes sp. NPDC049118]|uniref:effector-associated domain EAD1-containing protein n=1 Tax=Actinoplanes sp. NPDC049118 TaxID=3155769 RepID=UPI0033D9B79D
MTRLTYAELVQQDAFRVLAELYPDEDSIGFLLEDIGLSANDFPPFGRLPAKDQWRSICRVIDRGRYVNVDLVTLLSKIAHQYPGNGSLKALLEPARNDYELRVLCLSAGPIDENRLRLGAEHRAILDATARSRRPVLAILQPAARTDDLINRVIDAEPHVVHFAGHGSAAGELLLEDEGGWARPVPVEALARLLASIPKLQSVVLTSCFSGAYAGLLRHVSDAVVGSPRPLADQCALAFVGPFYRALGEGWDVRKSFQVATAAMDVTGCPQHELLIEPAA